MGQLGIRIINIALFTASCFFSAGVFNHIARSQLAPDYVSAFEPVERTPVEKPRTDPREAILARNLFDAKVALGDEPPEPAPPAPPVQEAQATKLPIELLGTMAGEPASISTAVINNTRKKKHQVVRVGDTLRDFEHVRVTAIEPRRVLLRNREITEELLLSKAEPRASAKAKSSRRSSSGALQRLRDRKARARAKRGSPAVVPAVEAPRDDARLRGIQGALSQDLIRDLAPAYDAEGKVSGVRVGNIARGGLLARAGLEANDVIESVGGISIDSAGAAARVLRELSKCKPLTLSSKGPSGTKTLDITKTLLANMNCTN